MARRPRKRRVVRQRLAENDLREQISYIARDNPAAAVRYLDAVEHAFNRIAESPDVGVLWEFGDPRLDGIRAWPVPRFRRYLVFYRAFDDEVQILRVLHGARDIDSVFGSDE